LVERAECLLLLEIDFLTLPVFGFRHIAPCMELSGRPDEILGQLDALVLDFNLGVKLGNLALDALRQRGKAVALGCGAFFLG
jgi:hypothetical protein